MADNASSGNSGDKKILVGRIGAAHGLRGQVRINSFTENPLSIADYSPLYTDRAGLKLTITKSRLAKNVVIAKLAGIDERTSAEALNGVELFVPRSKLPPCDNEDEFLHVDLVGLQARLDTGQVLGEVTTIANFGAGDLLEVREPDGETKLFAFTRAVVPQVNIKEGFVLIVPPVEIEGDQKQ
ncbi:MAG TPA: ribosome maturation factor RimM [Devosia sp.]|nr:ribosome maturation factor RimM [Devosia sp.]